jgi:hypothetical protein
MTRSPHGKTAVDTRAGKLLAAIKPLWLICCALCLATIRLRGADEVAFSRPIDPGQLTRVTFGSYSHWLQPWRAYLETMTASHFLDGMGIVSPARR